MARKKKHEEHENHERWLVSYADFITLLFAFFVVMYAVSSVNEGKYRVLSDSMVAAFRSPTKSIMPIQVGNIVKSPSGSAVELPPMATNRMIDKTRRGKVGGGEGAGAGSADGDVVQAALHRVANDLAKAFEALIAQDLVTVREGQLWLEVEIRAAVLFDSGSAQVKPEALPVVDQVVDILAGIPNSVRVEGYTDNVPISTGQYRSNWDLSAARAGSMVHRLLQRGLDPLRLSLAGYGEYRPIADNATADGRSRNRRVVLVVLATPGAVAQRELELSLIRQGPDDVGFRLPDGTPDAVSIVTQAMAPTATAQSAPGQTVPAAKTDTPRWPADRRAAGQVPDFVPSPLPPQLVPPL
ncbi:MAG: flagellar motor protein MotD [Immundisolibacter sp.]|uniref:flagellar motor protein MotD n=1 Tax=Immundisolibacter sp. TaxID=1934948 RepID=UPI001987BC30|nr:flagellar motor protein MotD [Immundisolibacter sp.]MBC7162968.1 flagellar motor protein MotD [Immundisolibacter sp.]